MKIVMVFGTFDGVHPGHEYFFREAKKLGDWLVVVVARDQTVKKVKNEFPRNNESKRQEAVEQISCVDQVVLGSKSSPYTIFNSVQPDVICLGYDQETYIDNLPAALEQRGIESEIIRLDAHQSDRYKSSLINKKNHQSPN